MTRPKSHQRRDRRSDDYIRRRREGKDRITQKELRVILSLRTLDTHCKDLRDNIVERLLNGALIEPGDLAAEISDRESRTISFDRLVEVVGKEEAIRIRDEIWPTVHTYLKITHR